MSSKRDDGSGAWISAKRIGPGTNGPPLRENIKETADDEGSISCYRGDGRRSRTRGPRVGRTLTRQPAGESVAIESTRKIKLV